MIGRSADIGSVLTRTDFVRHGLGLRRTGAEKEWHHFVVHGDERRIIVNFSLSQEGFGDDPESWGRPGRTVARVIVIVEAAGWTGVIETIDERQVHITSDGLTLRMGPNEMRIDQGTYAVELDLPAGIGGRLVFLPRARPFVVGNHGLGPAGRLSWLLLPRLEAHGHLRVGTQRLAFRAAPAYHDHNWGSFRWGGDFGWEWGSALPADPSQPWSIVFMRMTDQSRHRALSQGMYVWHKDDMAAMFRDATTEVSVSGFLSEPPRMTLPAVMRFLTPGRASGIPAELLVTGRRGQDWLRLRFTPREYTRIAIPSELDLTRVVTLNEISGEIEAHGVVGGIPLDIGGSGVFELLI